MSTSKSTMHQNFPVGMLVSIGRGVLNNPAGSKGVVYENYTIGKDHFGSSIIFPNGAYDGFSEECIENCQVKPIGIVSSIKEYEFQNVGRLSEDFDRGVFKDAFS